MQAGVVERLLLRKGEYHACTHGLRGKEGGEAIELLCRASQRLGRTLLAL
jgi:hypothetical protein